MNVFKRLQRCRAELRTIPIKESGNNSFAKYTYMELGDFLPHIVSLCDTHGLCPVISFGEVATLTIYNSDKPEESIVFESPMSTAELKGCHPVQNLGAVETYTRRYLYVAAFDIVEHDALDSTHGNDADKKNGASPPQTPPPKATSKPTTLDLIEKRIDSFATKTAQELTAWFLDDENLKLVEAKSSLSAEELSKANKYFAQMKDTLYKRKPTTAQRQGAPTAQAGDFF